MLYRSHCEVGVRLVMDGEWVKDSLQVLWVMLLLLWTGYVIVVAQLPTYWGVS